MGSTIINTCEKCGKEEILQLEKNHNTEFWKVGYTLRHAASREFSLKDEALWCRECCESIGLLPLHELKDKPEEVRQTTLEEKIIEILEALGFRQSE